MKHGSMSAAAADGNGPGAGWWQTIGLESGEAGRWRIGALELVVCRQAREWLIFESACEELDEPDWTFDRILGRPEDLEAVVRHVFRETDPRVRLSPALADRAVVTSPRIPLHVPPDEETTLYVGSPLWVRVETAERALPLHEVAVRRPSDTWFGPNTREGELCYATRTKAAVDLDNVERTTRRAVTALHIRNRASTPLHVEKVKLPVPFLSVFHSGDTGLLWTEAVTVVHREESDVGDVEVHEGPPANAGRTELLTGPRQQPERGLLLRAFGGLFL